MDRGPDEENDSGATSGDGATGSVKQDRDGDGVEDSKDAFPDNRREAYDRDGDGVGDNADDCPDDPGGWEDPDGDGACDPSAAVPDDNNGASSGTGAGSADSDGDGFANDNDAFPNNKNEWKDSDGDGVGDNGDAFPADPGESRDSDGDGVGDNEEARAPSNRPPSFPPQTITATNHYEYDIVYGRPQIRSANTTITLSEPASDPDGDPLTYSWTVARTNPGDPDPGTITGDGLEGNWTRPAYNGEPARATVTVTADDGRGGTGKYNIVFK